ncbi:MAG: hypothetical protein RL653_2886 [Pseudomonadota bacterium]
MSARGQNSLEMVLLTSALLLGVGGIATFAPDMMAVITIYMRGFWVVLGLPFG